MSKPLRRTVVDWASSIVHDWVTLLAIHLGRSVEEIQSNGLQASDFPPAGDLEVRLADGSRMTFKNAFSLVDPTSYSIAVFSEHCGHHVFPYHEATIVRVHRQLVFEHL